MDRESHMTKHWFLDHHEDQDPPQFRFRIIGSYKDCMFRQVKEAVRIQNRPNSLNSKGEFGGGNITRLTVDKSKFDKKKEELEEKRKQEDEDVSWEKFLSNKMEFPGKRKAVEMGTPSPVTKRVKGQEVIGNAQEEDDWSPSDKVKEPETIPVDWIAQSGQDDETIPEVWKVPAAKEILASQENKDEDCVEKAHENVEKSLENDAKNESSPEGWTKRNEEKDELSHGFGLANEQVITLDSSTIETQAADLDRVVQPEAGHSTKEEELDIVVQSKPGSATTGFKPKVTGN